MSDRGAVVLDRRPARAAAVRAELERHGHVVRSTTRLVEALAASVHASLFAVGVDDGTDLDAIRTIRAVPGGEEAVIVGTTDVQGSDVAALIRAGASDVWELPETDDVPDMRVRLALAKHYARLQVEHSRVGGELSVLKRALDLTGTGFVLTDPRLEDNPIVYANRSFAEVTGYPLEETLGRNCRFLQGPEREQDGVRELAEAIVQARPASVTVHNRRRDGTSFVNEVHVAPVRDDDGRVVRFVGVQIDVTQQQQSGARLALEQQARRRAESERRRIAIVAAGTASMDRAESADAVLRALRVAVGDLLGPETAVDVTPGSVEVDERTWLIRGADDERGGLVLGRSPVDVDDRSAVDLLVERTDEALRRVGRRVAERGLVRAMRDSLEPLRPVTLGALDVDARVVPAGPGLAVGGDFVENVRFADGSVGIALGDVTGQGPRAAALTGLVRHTVRACAQMSDSPAQALRLVNTMILDVPDRRRYSAVTVVQLQGEERLRFALAGSPLPVALDADGARAVGTPGTLLGASTRPTLTDTEIELAPGAALAWFTDGVTEPLGGGVEASSRIAAMLSAIGSAQELSDAVLRAGAEGEVRRPDDRAVVAARRP